MFISSSSREILFRVVYVGPAESGKTTNLRYVFEKTRPTERDRLYFVSLGADALYWFDLRVPSLGAIDGHGVRLRLQALRGPLRELDSLARVLADADGIVFVADVDPERTASNLRALSDLSTWLEQLPRSPPVIVQLNKCQTFGDRAAHATYEALCETSPNVAAWARIDAEANTGVGVYDALKAMVQRIVAAHARGELASPSADAEPVLDSLAANRALARWVHVRERSFGDLSIEWRMSTPVDERGALAYGVARHEPRAGEPVLTYFTIGLALLSESEPRFELLACSAARADADIVAVLAALGERIAHHPACAELDGPMTVELDDPSHPGAVRYLLVLPSQDPGFAEEDDELSALLGSAAKIEPLLVMSLGFDEWQALQHLERDRWLERLRAGGRGLTFHRRSDA